jgi:hypothetical protein
MSGDLEDIARDIAENRKEHLRTIGALSTLLQKLIPGRSGGGASAASNRRILGMPGGSPKCRLPAADNIARH